MDPIPNSGSSVHEQSFKQLRTLVHAAAVSILILAGTLFVFFYRQVVTVRKNTADLVNYIQEYQSSSAQDFIAEVHRQFAEFTREHPDFTPVYRRYFGTNAPPPKLQSTNTGGLQMAPARVAPAPPKEQ